MSDKPRTAEQARILFRQIIRELPEEERGRLIYFAGISDRPDTAENAIEFFKEIVAKLPSDELSELCVEFGSGLEGQEDRIFVASMPGEADYMIIPNELGKDALVVLTAKMWSDFLKCMNDIEKRRKLSEKQRTKDWAFLNDTINRFAEQSKDVADRRRKLGKCREVRKEAKAKRKEAIDALFTEDYNRSEIYEQMRLKHEPLMKGRGQDCMNEDSMWESYIDAGGCHPKALRPRGRPKKNGGNCINGD
jgi:hypothetical protein